MFTDPNYDAIAFVAAYGTLPVMIAWCAIVIYRSSAHHLFARPCSIVAGIIGMLVAAAILNAIDVSKYQQTDFVFGFVFALWFAAIGGLIGSAIDRFRFGRADASRTRST